jgi:2-dehydropantoate 2-reductase
MTDRVKELAAPFEAAKGVEVFAVTDIVQRMWKSWFISRLPPQ